jgi:hypothetical protein
VTSHQIKVTLPRIEVGPRDLVFEVSIDDTAQGRLHVSKGGLDWWPTTPNGSKYTKTWSQLRTFMEGNAKGLVGNESSWPPPDEEIVDSRDSLLCELGFDYFGSMTDLVDEMMESDFGIWLSVDEEGDGAEGFVISTGKYDVTMQYPFTWREFREAVEDLDTMGRAETAYDELRTLGFPEYEGVLGIEDALPTRCRTKISIHPGANSRS